jgi:hypothetical protein
MITSLDDTSIESPPTQAENDSSVYYIGSPAIMSAMMGKNEINSDGWYKVKPHIDAEFEKPKQAEDDPIFNIPPIGALFLTAVLGFVAYTQNMQPPHIPQTEAQQSIDQRPAGEKPVCPPNYNCF